LSPPGGIAPLINHAECAVGAVVGQIVEHSKSPELVKPADAFVKSLVSAVKDL
jgi:hypothetical protein